MKRAKITASWRAKVQIEWMALSLRLRYWSKLKMMRAIALCLLMVPLGNAMTIYHAFRPDPKSVTPYFLVLIFAAVAVLSIGVLVWAFAKRIQTGKIKARQDPEKIAVEAQIAMLRGREFAQKEARDLAAELAVHSAADAGPVNGGSNSQTPLRPKSVRRL